MLTKTPKQGDEVVAVYTKDYSSRTCRPVVTVKIDKVGNKYLWVDGDKFTFDGKGAGNTTGYELFDSQESYDRHIQRGKNKARIFKLVSAHDFGNGLSDETLEHILELIEGK